MSLPELPFDPRYTGENRCWPCTAVNAALVAVVALLVWPLAPLFAVGIASVGGVLIVARGYVVPYTPQFAPKLVARLPVRFGTEPPGPVSDSMVDSEGTDALLESLFAAGVLVGDDDLVLGESVHAAWRERIGELRAADAQTLADATADAAPFDAHGEAHGEHVLLVDSREIWLPRAVAIADTAAVETLVETGFPRDAAAAAARPLRLFLNECPACGGKIEETTITNCCGGTRGVHDRPDTAVLACSTCETMLFEFDDAADGTDD
ncbi:hypothetical protein ACNS7O_01415 [Haloferacaceae archaeon DSL9]